MIARRSPAPSTGGAHDGLHPRILRRAARELAGGSGRAFRRRRRDPAGGALAAPRNVGADPLGGAGRRMGDRRPRPRRPPLPGATITATEIWSGTAWATATGADAPLAGPLGALYPAAGPYRVRATLGAGAAPLAALEAYRRLAEYLAAQDPGPATRYSIEVGALTEASLRPADWAAKAIFQSGAADLLRPYRRLVA